MKRININDMSYNNEPIIQSSQPVSASSTGTLNDTSFKPFNYDPKIFISDDLATELTLSAHGITSGDIQELPLSAFSNYSKNKESLNYHQHKKIVETYIGNKLIYLSGGDNPGEYITGDLVTPKNPYRNILSRYQPSILISQEPDKVSTREISGLINPKNVAVLMYTSMNPVPFFIEEDIAPGELYIMADPELYGNGYGTQQYSNLAPPIDHVESASWTKAPIVDIGRAGTIINSKNLPLFYNYTSKEQTLGVPPYGISKFTDNFDFWSGSTRGDIWANADQFPLIEANRYPINSRQETLLTDKCDTPVTWKSDIYGNQYVLYKAAPSKLRKPGGGSDTDGIPDGKDDTYQSGLGQGVYDTYSEGEYGVIVEGDGGGGTVGSSDTGGFGLVGDSIECGTRPCDALGGVEVQTIWDQETATCKLPPDCDVDIDDIVLEFGGQVPLSECNYFMYGGEGFSPETSTETQLDITYTQPTLAGSATPYTSAGTVSAIIDGGWRPFNTSQDQTANQFQTTQSLNGFIDVSNYASASASWDPGDFTGSIVTWFPNYAVPSNGSFDRPHSPKLIPGSEEPGKRSSLTDLKYGLVFDDLDDIVDHSWRNTTQRRENEADGTYVIQEGGWIQSGDISSNPVTFFQTRCDQASYVVSTYGSGIPDFGEDIAACKIFKITRQAFIGEGLDMFMGGSSIGAAEKLRAFTRAALRGPMDVRYLKNPIETSVQGFKKFQFFGTRETLTEWLDYIRTIPGARTFPAGLFDYMEDPEYERIRISIIEGSGNHQGTGDNFVSSFLPKEPDVYPQGLGFPRLKGDPDIFYYVSGGVGPNNDEGDPLLYNLVSGGCSYLGTFATNNTDTEFYQFPQLPADPNTSIRITSLPLSSWYDLTCDNVYEYRAYNSLLIYQPVNLISDPGLIVTNASLSRPIQSEHPVSQYHNTVFGAKRGYFPPPVGHLRRQQTIPINTTAITGVDPALVGADIPIFNNLVESTSGDGFYVHDIWDGGGFGLFTPSDEINPDANKDTEGLPTLGSGDTTDRTNNQCYQEWLNSGSPAHWDVDRAQIIDGQCRFPVKPGFTFSGTTAPPTTGDRFCLTCVNLTGGEYIDTSCGDYVGYNTGTKQGNLPCQSQFLNSSAPQTPVLDVANMVKRASNSVDDFCPEIDIPTLWQRKYKTIRYDETGTNIYCRTLPNAVGDVTQIIPTLFTKYKDEQGVPLLHADQPFVDLDVIYDTIVLRQVTDTNAQGDERETIVVDRIGYKYESDEINVAGTSLQYIRSSFDPREQLLGHYFNERENIVITGVTRYVNDLLVYPELYKYEIASGKWSKIYPHVHVDVKPDFEFNVGYNILSIDPGHISYNDQTGHYSVTYAGQLQWIAGSDPNVDPTIVFFSHKFAPEPKDNNLLTPIVTNGIHSDENDINGTSSGFSGSSKFVVDGRNTTTQTVSAFTPSYEIQLDLKDVERTADGFNPILYIDIDWGDGERVRVHRDLDGTLGDLQRYGSIAGTLNYLSKNTILKRGESGVGADVSVDRHSLTHKYFLTGLEGNVVISLSGVYADATPPLLKQIQLQTFEYTLSEISSQVKILDTKLISPDPQNLKKETLVMTMESQSPEFVFYNKLNYIE